MDAMAITLVELAEAKDKIARQDQAIFSAYLGIIVLKTMCKKVKLAAGEQRCSDLLIELDTAFPDMAGSFNIEAENKNEHVRWAVSRWEAEVKNRPMQNIHRRALDDTWRQVIRHFGGDDIGLCGLLHDELLGRGQ